ncbi:hypothetical protein PFICI_11985 [Pestalotiopsis fici W106-1]|uniref:Uncharacterized protein n=1 Tax=Pestalotiopsis fici (strain W106-1 / CGMCC3.15140) TaxID=1229662 RepID=W3WRX1_PESFW|nr:uncharacterized protein PFICI_11985 [Pestalotiopsis fici W106-1]ETS76598.1 hypothetical protein PFICI_11985 [Pestalotiopsis fici W106-1]
MGGFHRHAPDDFLAPLTTHNLQRLEKSLTIPSELSSAHVGPPAVRKNQHRTNQHCKRTADHCQPRGHVDPLDPNQQVRCNVMEVMPSRQNERRRPSHGLSAGSIDAKKGSSKIFYTTTSLHDGLWDPELKVVPSARSSNTSRSVQHLSTWKQLPALPQVTYLAEATPGPSASAWHGDQFDTLRNDTADRTPDSQIHPKQIQISSRSSRSASLSDHDKDLRLLSIALMTVDNGFEDQWWFQGPKEQIDWWSRGWGNETNSTLPHNVASAVELPVDADTHMRDLSSISSQQAFPNDLVSPLSDSGTL